MLQVLAVTGAIGSGKSLVCRFLAERGFPVYDSDSRTKALYDTDNELLEAVRKKMSAYWTGDGGIPGDFLVMEDGRLDRKALASIIFREGPSGSMALRDLESVVHPAVLRDFLEWKDSPEVVAQAEFGTAVIESAIILDNPVFRDVPDKVLLVDAPEGAGIARAAMRDHESAERIAARMESRQKVFSGTDGGKQHPDVDYIIENTGTPEDLRRKVEQFIDTNYRK